MIDRSLANQNAVKRLLAAEPVLEGVASARDAVAGFLGNLILTSGPPMPWAEYEGGQRDAVVGAALFERLATSRSDADKLLAEGRIKLDGCHRYGCVGSLAGVYSASMPVFVVRNRTAGNFGYCNMYEGKSPKRLNYGVYDDEVHARLMFVQDVIAPVIAEAALRANGVALKPIIKRALHMGDEMHSRNTAASLLFAREIFPYLLDFPDDLQKAVRQTVEVLTEDDYFFLRLSMAASKAMADAMHGIEGSSIITAMGFNCKGFAIRVSGLGDAWFLGPPPDVEAKLFEGHGQEEICWMGGESPITETVGLGGFAQAAAFALQAYQGGTPDAMVERNRAMYEITVSEHAEFHIPYLGYRGTPVGIDLFKVLETGIMPVMDIGIAGVGGGQIGAGVVTAPRECFLRAAEVYRRRYDT